METGGSPAEIAKSAAGADSQPTAGTEALQPRCGASTRRYARWWLIGPLLLLGAEIALLTPQVEFHSGPMALLASPEVASALIFAAVLLCAIGGEALAGKLAVGSPLARLAWLAVHLACYKMFFEMSTTLASRAPESVGSWLHAGVWLLLAGAVGISAVLAWFSFDAARRMAAAAWRQTLWALLLGALLAVLTPVVQPLWHSVDKPAVTIASHLLEWRYPNESVAYYDVQHADNPVLEVRRPTFWSNSIQNGRNVWELHPSREVGIEVTPYCAEMESLAAFLMLGVALLAVHWRSASLWHWSLVMVAGTATLYFLNAVRLALLVEVGVRKGVMASVHMAHSRLSGMAFLAISASIMMLTRRLWCPQPKGPPEESSSTPVAPETA